MTPAVTPAVTPTVTPKVLGVEAPVARGLAMGAAGHGLGTAAMVEEKQAFPFAAIMMALVRLARYVRYTPRRRV